MILLQGLPNCSAGSLGPFFAPLPSYVMQNLCLCWQRPFSVVTTGVSDSSPCMFILSHPPLSLMFQDLAYFLQPKQLCLPSVSDALLLLLSLLCWVLDCPCKHLFSLYSALSPSFLLPPRFPPLLLPFLQDKPAWWDVLEEQAVYH